MRNGYQYLNENKPNNIIDNQEIFLEGKFANNKENNLYNDDYPTGLLNYNSLPLPNYDYKVIDTYINNDKMNNNLSDDFFSYSDSDLKEFFSEFENIQDFPNLEDPNQNQINLIEKKDFEINIENNNSNRDKKLLNQDLSDSQVNFGKIMNNHPKENKMNKKDIKNFFAEVQNMNLYGENIANGFLNQNHLNFYDYYRFKENSKMKSRFKLKENGKSKNLTLKEKIIKNLLEKNIKIYPCYNKGYNDKKFNITGSGNFTLCQEYIENFLNQDKIEQINLKIMKKKLFLTEINKKGNLINEKEEENVFNSTKSNYIYLENHFKIFYFLFFENDEQNNILKFNEKIKFGDLKQKVKNICQKQYSNIIEDLSKFNIK